MDKEYYKAVGAYFGYPDCCIEHFTERVEEIQKIQAEGGKEFPNINENQCAVIDGEGFIPCPTCADKLVESGKRLDTIIDNEKRQAPYTYLEVKCDEGKSRAVEAHLSNLREIWENEE